MGADQAGWGVAGLGHCKSLTGRGHKLDGWQGWVTVGHSFGLAGMSHCKPPSHPTGGGYMLAGWGDWLAWLTARHLYAGQ